MEFFSRTRCGIDVVDKGKRARFYGEIGDRCFYAYASTMRWMEPKRDEPVIEEERNEWIQAINEYQQDLKYKIIFLDDNGDEMFPRELTQKEKRRNWINHHTDYLFWGGPVLLAFIFIIIVLGICM